MSLRNEARELLNNIFLINRVEEVEHWAKIVDILFLYVDLEIEDRLKKHIEEKG